MKLLYKNKAINHFKITLGIYNRVIGQVIMDTNKGLMLKLQLFNSLWWLIYIINPVDDTLNITLLYSPTAAALQFLKKLTPFIMDTVLFHQIMHKTRNLSFEISELFHDIHVNL